MKNLSQDTKDFLHSIKCLLIVIPFFILLILALLNK